MLITAEMADSQEDKAAGQRSRTRVPSVLWILLLE